MRFKNRHSSSLNTLVDILRGSVRKGKCAVSATTGLPSVTCCCIFCAATLDYVWTHKRDTVPCFLQVPCTLPSCGTPVHPSKLRSSSTFIFFMINLARAGTLLCSPCPLGTVWLQLLSHLACIVLVVSSMRLWVVWGTSHFYSCIFQTWRYAVLWTWWQDEWMDQCIRKAQRHSCSTLSYILCDGGRKSQLKQTLVSLPISAVPSFGTLSVSPLIVSSHPR